MNVRFTRKLTLFDASGTEKKKNKIRDDFEALATKEREKLIQDWT